MTYPITPNPSIHDVPNNSTAQKMLFTGGQLSTWAEQLPLAMTLELVDAILSALGASQDEISAINSETTSLYDEVLSWLSGANSSSSAAAWNAVVTQLEDFLTTGDWSDLSTAWTDLLDALTGGSGSTVSDVATAASGWSAVVTELEDFLTTGSWSDLSAAWTDLLQAIFGSNTAGALTSSIPAPAVTNTSTSAQPFSNFPNAASIQAGGGVSWDGTVSYNGSAGSMKYAADGVQIGARGILAPVQPGQTVTLSAEVMWSGLTAASGTHPIQLQVIPWSGTATAGTAGTPVEVTELTWPDSATTWVPVSGSYTVPDTGVGFVQMYPVLTEDATAGDLWWNDCTTTISGGFLPTMQSDLNALKADSEAATAATQTFLQAIQTAITGYTTWAVFIAALQSAYQIWVTTESGLAADEFATLQQMLNSLLGIDPTSGQIAATNVQGVGGLQNLETTFTTMWNQAIAAVAADLDAVGLSGFAQSLSGLAVQVTNTQNVTLSNATILATVDNCPVAAGLETTVESNGQYDVAVSLSAAQVAKTTSRGTCITMSQAKTLGFIQWFGSYTSAPTGFVINFYQMDSSGDLTYLFSSPDLSGTIASSGAPWNVWDIPTADQIAVTAGDIIGVEFQITTSGDVNAWGFIAGPTSNHPSADVKQKGFTQNWAGAASTIAAASIGWSQYAPYVGLGVGTPPATPFLPDPNTYTTDSTHTPPYWANFVDLAAFADGGGAEGFTGGVGCGGCQGQSATGTLTIGVTNPTTPGMDIPTGGTITITVGQGGPGGVDFTPGSAGTGTTFTWTDMAGATQTLTAAGGLGGLPANNITSWGLPAVTFTYEGTPYIGGATNYTGGVGNAPGGGGAGGYGTGGAGAPGQAWTVDRQS